MKLGRCTGSTRLSNSTLNYKFYISAFLLSSAMSLLGVHNKGSLLKLSSYLQSSTLLYDFTLMYTNVYMEKSELYVDYRLIARLLSSYSGWSRTCGQGLSGSPLVHRCLRSPLCFPNVRNVPNMSNNRCSKVMRTNIENEKSAFIV